MASRCIRCGRTLPTYSHKKLCQDCDTTLLHWAEWVERSIHRHPDYYDYIQSDAWHKKAEDAKRRAGWRCQICNSNEDLEAHHRTYERLGYERPDDITVICAKCHDLFSRHGRLATERR